MEYSEETDAGQGPGETTKLSEMGEICLPFQASASVGHCADDTQKAHVEKTTENENSGKCLADDDANDPQDASNTKPNFACPSSSYVEKSLSPAEFTETNYELQQAYRILRDLMSEGNKGVNLPFMDSIEVSEEDVEDYYEVITNPMWLKKVRHKFLKREYNNITEFVADVRLILENCYRYNGPDSQLTKKALRLEQMLEQKLALLPRELRDKTTLEITSGRPVNDDIIATRRRSTRQSLDYTSILLQLVRHEKADRNRELKKKLTEGKKAVKEEKEKEVLVWEDKLLEEPLKTQMKAMWELPMIGHFFYLCQIVLNMPEVSQFELERILVIPRASSLLPKIMTSLLSSPMQRACLDRNPPMPYKVWQARLQNRIQSWYKIYHARENRGDLVFQQLGIEANFFKILGPQNPLNEKQFHELSFHQRIWCVKGLCDYILYNHRTVQDSLNDQLMDDMREYVLGRDSVGNTYLHFPQFCGQDLRIYKQRRSNKPPSPSCWGAPYTMKRKLPKTEQIISTPPLPPPKKLKIEAPKKPVKKVQPSEPTLAQLCARRSPRFSKIQVLEKISEDEPEDTDESDYVTSEEELPLEENDSEEEDDNDIEPDITKFELVVDSVESLRTFMCKFKIAYDNMRNKKEKQPYSRYEAELYRRLKNLLVELEPWESKLQKSAQRIRNRLRREWEDFVEDVEEVEDIWGSDGESMDGKSSSSLSTSDNSKEETVNSFAKAIFKPERPATRARTAKIEPVKLEEISTEELLNQDDDSCEYRTRGRLQQLRIMRSLPKKNIKSGREIKVNGKQSLLLAHSMHNTTTQAKELYAWETLRQILVPASSAKNADPGAVGDAQAQEDINLHKQELSDKVDEPHVQTPAASPEKQNLLHAKLDMLGAMQAAMAKKPYAACQGTKYPQSNSSKTVLKKLPSIKNNHILQSTFQRVGSNMSFFPNQQTKPAAHLLAKKILPPMTSAALTKPVPKFKTAKFNSIPTKQHLSDISSVAENTKNLKRLLEQVNKVAPTTLLSSTVSSPADGETSTQPKAQIMLFPMYDTDGKSVVYRVTSNKPLSSIPGVDVKKIALALATSTTSELPPDFLIEKISVDDNLLHGQAPNISQNALAEIAFCQAKATAKSAAIKPSASLPKPPRATSAVRVAKALTPLPHNAAISTGMVNKIMPITPALPQKTIPHLHTPPKLVQTTSGGSPSIGCMTSGTPTSFVLSSPSQQASICAKVQTVQSPISAESMAQQQMILVPVQNQHGQTMYLQIPAQAGAASVGKPAVTQIRTLPVSQPTQTGGILGNSTPTRVSSMTPMKVAPSVVQRLIPALSTKRQMPSFSTAMLVSEPPPLALLSNQKTPNSKAIGPQQAGPLVIAGVPQTSSVARNITNTTVLQRTPVSDTFLRSDFANNKLATSVNVVLSTSTTPKNLLTPIKANEQPAQQQIQLNAATQAVTNQQILSPASSRLAHVTLPSGSNVVAVNPGIVHSNQDVLSASVASLVAKNPALAATVQKYVQAGHKVMISQQGNQLVLQAYPPQGNVTANHVNNTSSVVTMPQKQVIATSSQSNTGLLHRGNPASVLPVQNWVTLNAAANRTQNNTVSKMSSPNIAQNVVRPPTILQSSTDNSISAQVKTAQTSVSTMLQNVLCQTVMSNPSSSGILANSPVMTSPEGNADTLYKTASIPTTTTTQHKLVMIRDSVTDKQTLGILLDNGQVVPLNAGISIANSTVS